MHVDRFNVPADVHRHLSTAVLADVIAQFHPEGDCYICHNPLGKTGRFSLRLDENGPVAVVVPSHAPCHASSSASVTALGVPEGTYRTLPMGIPVESGGRQAVLPVLAVNPSIDVVTLTRDQDGRLRDNRESTLLGVGWEKYAPNVPFRGDSEAVGTVTAPTHPGGDWMVSTMMGTWAMQCPPEVDDSIREHGSLFVMALHTTSVTDLISAPDVFGAITAAFVEEPAMLGRCQYKP